MTNMGRVRVDQCSSDTAKDVVKSELEILKTKPHWKKAYFYLWDEARISTRSQHGVLINVSMLGSALK